MSIGNPPLFEKQINFYIRGRKSSAALIERERKGE